MNVNKQFDQNLFFNKNQQYVSKENPFTYTNVFIGKNTNETNYVNINPKKQPPKFKNPLDEQMEEKRTRCPSIYNA